MVLEIKKSDKKRMIFIRNISNIWLQTELYTHPKFKLTFLI